MDKAAESLRRIWETYIAGPFSRFEFRDAVDILLLCAILYVAYLFVRERRAAKLAIGLLLVMVFYAFCDICNLRATRRLIGGIASTGILMIAVIFQPELRDGLEKLGLLPWGFRSDSRKRAAVLTHTINEAVDAACEIARAERDGALIVIERRTKLGEYMKTDCCLLDARVSSDLLRNIFVNRSPLHDGAVIIRGDRILAAGCRLPMSTAPNAGSQGGDRNGTRHEAAIGVTEVSDCAVIVVSEERHVISVANHGCLKRGYNRNAEALRDEAKAKAVRDELRRDLYACLIGEIEPAKPAKPAKPARDRAKRGRRAADAGASGTDDPRETIDDR